ncbi:hypothetical protein ACE7GA_17485 [Roseomonas sp. CCTCC AB2023176]|uniref:hypothetical protein n=1 Tax=Roseomonas sp. CCTCC AB2023176 TaxID=3342640 RepID=UPI0035DDE3AE
MPQPTRRVVLAASLTTGLSAGLAATLSRTASAQEAPVRLFRVVGARDEVTIGLTAADLDAMGDAPDAARLARKLVADGQLTAWQYVVGRAPDGSTRHAATRQVAILRSDTLRIEPYTAAIPVAAPPAR